MKQPKLLVGAFAVAIGIWSMLALSQQPGSTYAAPLPPSNFFSGYFTGMEDHTGFLHRQYGWQDVQGLLYFKDAVTGTYTVELNGTTKNCTQKLRWIFVNPARGNVIWPLDGDTLSALDNMTINTPFQSYDQLIRIGGLYTKCDNGTNYIYGQVSFEYSGSLQHNIVVWVDVDTANNNYNWAFAQTLLFTNHTTVGYLVDDVLGVADVSGFGLSIANQGTGDVPPPEDDTPPEDTQQHHGWQTTQRIAKDDCSGYVPPEDLSNSYYDKKCRNDKNQEDNKDTPTPEKTIIQNFNPTTDDIITTQRQSQYQYSNEQVGAYLFAKNVGITTIDSIEDAKLDQPVLRMRLAKMMVEYAIKVLHKTPDASRQCNFADMADQSPEMQAYAKRGCQLGIIGLEYDGRPATEFMPMEIVTRDQFGTAFDRMINPGENPAQASCRYCSHLNALHTEGIIKAIDPSIVELRGYVMIMMSRAYALLQNK